MIRSEECYEQPAESESQSEAKSKESEPKSAESAKSRSTEQKRSVQAVLMKKDPLFRKRIFIFVYRHYPT